MVAQLDDDEGEILEVQKNILEFHAEMVLLLHYSVLNLTGATFPMLICSNMQKLKLTKNNIVLEGIFVRFELVLIDSISILIYSSKMRKFLKLFVYWVLLNHILILIKTLGNLINWINSHTKS